MTWGYQLDYAREIAQDLHEIEQLERHVPLVAVLTDAERAWGHVTLADFLFGNHAERAPLLGIPLGELPDLADYCDRDIPELHQDKNQPGWYSRSEATFVRLEKELGGSYVVQDPQVGLKKLRARLARHRRNQQKYG